MFCRSLGSVRGMRALLTVLVVSGALSIAASGCGRRTLVVVGEDAEGDDGGGEDAAEGEGVNVGSGFEISIGDAVSLVAEVMGVEVEVFSDEPRMRPEASEVSRLWASNAKAQSLLDWTPECGLLEGFRRGIELTADWFSDPSNLSGYRVGHYEV